MDAIEDDCASFTTVANVGRLSGEQQAEQLVSNDELYREPGLGLEV